MKILIDECVLRPIIKLLLNHEISSVQEAGWGAYKNGELLKLAEPSFDLFITSDQNIRYQQNLANRRIAILELSTNDWRAIKANSALIESAITEIKEGDFIELHIPPLA